MFTNMDYLVQFFQNDQGCDSQNDQGQNDQGCEEDCFSDKSYDPSEKSFDPGDCSEEEGLDPEEELDPDWDDDPLTLNQLSVNGE